ncbi:H4MPT-linked C1 transfer pathway protein [Rhizobacter sp. AJA081-3]|uniref:hydantoinase/oxoprolinase family protein n=1 Tax=Rhizobacter sp. AJA081-3 TaxID=2753607 RepID=UPI001AE04443|nr:hydantoinase/oxoprolinase family protein [Rhizobacter sp. AJA081-3]QTN21230.1 H4MPT-linked C1 transfer pathway protein [Rhizobacter sp. AJA081-3]
MRERKVIGWDIGGAHVKAALLRGGAVLDAAQWPCPLWQGLDHLERVLAQAQARWPALGEHAHAVTMTGEMVDLFAHREDGVQRIAGLLAGHLPTPRFFAGDGGWFGAAQAGTQWEQIASANWLATARHAARAMPQAEGLLVDIGSTTTDLIAFRRGHVLTASRSDAQRLQHGELVYQGVVRTPLCALAQRIDWRGARLNVMNEFFATTADVYRLTGELDAAHDQHPSADNAPKDAAHTRARLARMIGLDERDGSAAQWLAFAQAWRSEQLAELRGQIERVVADHDLAAGATVVAAGCGAFLVPELVPEGWRFAAYASEVARLAPDALAGVAGWVQVGAPAVAVAALYGQEQA